MRYYVDTCVWADFVEGRTDDDFLIRCIENEDIVLYSYPLERELLNHVPVSQLTIIYSLLSAKSLIESVNVDETEKSEALNLANALEIPFPDILHAILARDNDAVLVTRDRHFLKLGNICKIKLL